MRLKKTVARLFERERVCRVATAGLRGMPHLVPVCQVVADGKIYFASGNDGRKALNLTANPRVAVTIDLYSDDWTLIKGVMVRAGRGSTRRDRGSGRSARSCIGSIRSTRTRPRWMSRTPSSSR